MTLVTLPRLHLLLACWSCLVAGLCLGNAVVAWEAGRTFGWSAMAAGAALLAAYFSARHGSRQATQQSQSRRPPAT